jgi:quercetin dioxygenase-like cupin family protein
MREERYHSLDKYLVYLGGTVPIYSPTDAEPFEVHGSRFESFVSTARGGDSLCAWRLVVAPATQGVAHRPSHEEVILLLGGQATIIIDGAAAPVEAGDVIHVPAGSELTVNGGPEGATAWVTTTAGLTARVGETTMAPPWAQ